jgi:hypothetical protein
MRHWALSLLLTQIAVLGLVTEAASQDACHEPDFDLPSVRSRR